MPSDIKPKSGHVARSHQISGRMTHFNQHREAIGRGEWGTLGHGVHWDKGSTVCLFRDNLTVSHVS